MSIAVQTAASMNMPLGTEVGLGPEDIVLGGDPAPLSKGGGAPSPISVHVHCGQPARRIKMALGMEVGLGPAWADLRNPGKEGGGQVPGQLGFRGAAPIN